MSHVPHAILSDLVVYTKYARHLPDKNRRETFEEVVCRVETFWKEMYPVLSEDITHHFKQVYAKRVLPSMRTMQFAGPPLASNHIRGYNCGFTQVRRVRDFSDIFYLLLCGTGVGYSVQKHHVDSLPTLHQPTGECVEVVPDTIEGWAQTIRVLLEAYTTLGAPAPVFDFSQVRPRGAKISSGGWSPGPEPLAHALAEIRSLLDASLSEGRDRLRPIDAHDIICLASDAVRSGGVRRSALIALFSPDDEEMLTCKNWENVEHRPHRYRANNSAVFKRDEVTEEQFRAIWKVAHESRAGEPGIFLVNAEDSGTNPCAEISLNPNQFCNLTEIDASYPHTQETLNAAAEAASFIGTLQASLTKFKYISQEWRTTTESEALLGVSMTGIASGNVDSLDLPEAVERIRQVNVSTAAALGINPAARLTCVKPSGTTSIVLGCSSGIHAWHAPHYIRRVRLRVDEPVAVYLKEHHPEIIEIDDEKPDQDIIVAVPIKAPRGAKFRTEDNLTSMLPRLERIYRDWVLPGHVSGEDRHNISCTLTVRDEEWADVLDWLWEKRDVYSGVTVYPAYDANYNQAPFEDITEEEYERMAARLHEVDFSKVVEREDLTVPEQEIACAGGACEIG